MAHYTLHPLSAWVATAATKKKQAAIPKAIVSGTVFRENGRSLPGAKITLVDKEGKLKHARAVTDRRGEFFIRVPAGETQYRVTVQAKGFKLQEKTVKIYESEKLTVNFQLSSNRKSSAKQD